MFIAGGYERCAISSSPDLIVGLSNRLDSRTFIVPYRVLSVAGRNGEVTDEQVETTLVQLCYSEQQYK